MFDFGMSLHNPVNFIISFIYSGLNQVLQLLIVNLELSLIASSKASLEGGSEHRVSGHIEPHS